MKKMLLIVSLCGIVFWVSAQAEPPATEAKPEVTKEKPMSFWMSQKLDYAKQILESLTSGDFDSLAQAAEKMQFVGKIEGFVRNRNHNYATQLRVFELANQELVRQAERRNIEGATLAFNQLTSSCVACHVQIREEGTASKTTPPTDSTGSKKDQ